MFIFFFFFLSSLLQALWTISPYPTPDENKLWKWLLDWTFLRYFVNRVTPLIFIALCSVFVFFVFFFFFFFSPRPWPRLGEGWCGDRHHWESSRLLVRGWRGKHADILSRCLLLQACCLGFGCFAVMTCHSFSFFSPTKTETRLGNLVRLFGSDSPRSQTSLLLVFRWTTTLHQCWFFLSSSSNIFKTSFFNQILHYDKYLFIYFIIVLVWYLFISFPLIPIKFILICLFTDIFSLSEYGNN